MLSYNGETCGNYEIGNPWVYRGHNLTWKNVHRLASYDNITFDYNYAGIRTKKTVNGVTTKYAINEDKILSEQKGSDTTTRIDYYYGFDGVTGFKYSNATYYYKKNTFGDILGIYDSFGNLVAKYVYDAWGNHKVLNPDGTENSSTTFIGNLNPYRYRSYYFDVETGLYYLQSRYYDPQVGRFISMDQVEYLVPDVVNGLNLYAYCVNDPVNKDDPKGTVWWFVKVAVGAVFGFVATVVADVVDDGKVFNGSKTFGDYAKNTAIGAGIGLASVFGLPAGIAAYMGYVAGEMAGSTLDKSDVKYNGKNKIENSYRILGIKDKLDYIRENNISENTGMSEFELWFEWTYHNAAYYLDIFGILRGHSKDVDFG